MAETVRLEWIKDRKGYELRDVLERRRGKRKKLDISVQRAVGEASQKKVNRLS